MESQLLQKVGVGIYDQWSGETVDKKMTFFNTGFKDYPWPLINNTGFWKGIPLFHSIALCLFNIPSVFTSFGCG